VRAVKLHDLHHVVTGYETTWTGESEIGAWELASGCAGFFWAWYLNLSALAIGIAIAPREIFRAFVRGRHTSNLYRAEGELRESTLLRSVGDLRGALGLDRPVPPARIGDVVIFSAFAVVSALMLLFPLLVIAWATIRWL
jgi:ubiquinone biosynthesis protein Coq4